jgi:hypothetical protein
MKPDFKIKGYSGLQNPNILKSKESKFRQFSITINHL